MPIYDYKCSKCGHQVEIIQKISDKPIKMCPKCGKSSFKKLISAPSFRLKGGGWYETDFKTGNKKNLVQSKEPNQKKQDQSKKPIKKDQPKSDT